MKKNIKKIFAGLAVLVSVSCANESMEPDASIDKKVETKTVSINFSAKMSVDDDVTKMGHTRHEGYTWKEKDSLYVIVATWIDGQWQEVDKHNRAYIHVKDGSISADGKTAEFEGNIKTVGDNDYIAIRALYPAFKFPGYQYYVKDGWENSLLMGAASGQLGVDDISIELKNASAFMCLNLSSDDNVMISRIELTALASEGSEKRYIPLSGWLSQVLIPFGDSRPSFMWDSTSTYGNVFLFCDRESEGVILPSEPESFYMSVPAGDYPNGFSIEVTDVMNRRYYRRFLKGKSVSLEQNTIYNLPNLKLSSGDFMSYSFPIPDKALRNALLAEGYISVLGDSVRCLITDKGHELRSLTVPDECKSLEGIQRFTSLTNLDVSRCMNLTELNLTGCKKLRELKVGSAPLSGLNLSGLSNFEQLTDGRAITGPIDLSGTGIKSLNNNSGYAAAEIILDSCKNLTLINLEQCNNMTKLSLKGCSSLTTIYCWHSDSLTSIDLSSSTELTVLSFGNLSRLTDVNLSANNKLESIDICSTALTDLDISDKLNLTSISCYGNENLEKLVITNCPELETLYCHECSLKTLNVGSCRKLRILECFCNRLTSLDVASDSLTALDCSQNMLGGTLDLAAFTKLSELGCDDNMLENLILPPSVSTLHCNTNNLSDLDISDKLNLIYVECSRNENLENLVITNCPELETLYCYECSLEALNVSSCRKLIDLNCAQNQLTSLDVAPDSLTSLDCSQNMLGGMLDLTAFTKLDYLACDYNMLEKLLLPPSVSILTCNTNNLSDLDITACPKLMKDNEVDSFYVGMQRQNKVLTLHLTSQQNEYWQRNYSEFEVNTNVTTDIR